MALTKITNDLLDLGSDTGALGLPKGTEAQRPSNPVEGTLRHNSEIDETKLETYNGTEWRKINQGEESYSVDYLVVAGGGSGGGYYGGGGGAGGLRTSYGSISGGLSEAEQPLLLFNNTSYSIQIGAGGASTSSGRNSGSNSQLHTISSIGGGGGGYITPSPLNYYGALSGGSGGGGPRDGNAQGNSSNFGSGTLGQGFDGGNVLAITWGAAGGGGGAGQSGGAGSITAGDGADYSPGGAGGSGLGVSISGSEIFYAGGGGGSSNNNTQGLGGIGGGGNAGGNTGPITSGQSGSPNTGGGGGGSHTSASGAGGSGVVILRMPTVNYSGTTTGSPTVTTDGSDTILTYTSSGTYTA